MNELQFKTGARGGLLGLAALAIGLVAIMAHPSVTVASPTTSCNPGDGPQFEAVLQARLDGDEGAEDGGVLCQMAAAGVAEPLTAASIEMSGAALASPSATLLWNPRRAGEFVYGVGLANLSTGRLAASAGFTHMSAFVSWRRVEPSKGEYLFLIRDSRGRPVSNDLSNVIEAAQKAGMKVALRLDDPPDWAGGKVYRVNPADVEEYVYQAVTYGEGTIAFVEVFTEMNLPGEWGTSPVDPAAYVKILAAAHRGARRADPGVKIVAASVSPRTGGLLGSMEDVEWLAGLYEAGGGPFFDLLGVHAYLGNHPPEAEPTCVPMCFRSLELWRAVMDRFDDTAKRVLITEVGVLESSPHNLGTFEWMEVAAQARADYLVRALQLANANYPWIVGALVFNLDYATTPWNPPDAEKYWFSLLNEDYSPRLAFDRIKQARENGTLP